MEDRRTTVAPRRRSGINPRQLSGKGRTVGVVRVSTGFGPPSPAGTLGSPHWGREPLPRFQFRSQQPVWVYLGVLWGE